MRLSDGDTAFQKLLNAIASGSFNYNNYEPNVTAQQQLATCSPGLISFNGFCGM